MPPRRCRCRPGGSARRRAAGTRPGCRGRCRAPRARACASRRPTAGPSTRPPFGVNLIAFESRFQTTCCRRAGVADDAAARASARSSSSGDAPSAPPSARSGLERQLDAPRPGRPRRRRARSLPRMMRDTSSRSSISLHLRAGVALDDLEAARQHRRVCRPSLRRMPIQASIACSGVRSSCDSTPRNSSFEPVRLARLGGQRVLDRDRRHARELHEDALVLGGELAVELVGELHDAEHAAVARRSAAPPASRASAGPATSSPGARQGGAVGLGHVMRGGAAADASGCRIAAPRGARLRAPRRQLGCRTASVTGARAGAGRRRWSRTCRAPMIWPALLGRRLPAARRSSCAEWIASEARLSWLQLVGIARAAPRAGG